MSSCQKVSHSSPTPMSLFSRSPRLALKRPRKLRKRRKPPLLLLLPVPQPKRLQKDNLQNQGANAGHNVGTRGGGEDGWGPCACPMCLIVAPARTSTRPPPILTTAPCPY